MPDGMTIIDVGIGGDDDLTPPTQLLFPVLESFPFRIWVRASLPLDPSSQERP
jgi:hypothetical protein